MFGLALVCVYGFKKTVGSDSTVCCCVCVDKVLSEEVLSISFSLEFVVGEILSLSRVGVCGFSSRFVVKDLNFGDSNLSVETLSWSFGVVHLD